MESVDIEGLYQEMLKAQKLNVALYQREYEGDRSLRLSQVGKREDKKVGGQGAEKIVRVAKIPFSFQKKIVKTAVSFLFGTPLQKMAEREGEAFSLFKESWDKARLDHLWRTLAEKVKSQTQGALAFFIRQDKEGDLCIRSRLLSYENGSLYPMIDSYGEMQSFGWEFTEAGEGEKQKRFLYVWDKANLRVYLKERSDKQWQLKERSAHLFGRIPIVYLDQEKPDWWEVKELIDRYEMSFSRFCDTNDYFASPMLKIRGQASSLPSKESTGKVLSLEIKETEKGNLMSSDVEYLTWDQAPEAIRLEMESARSLIYALSDTPDLSLDNLKGLGAVPSGFALEMLFMGATLKSRWSQGVWGTAVDRAVNILKGGLESIHPHLRGELVKLKVKTCFSSSLPRNTSQIISELTEANGGKPIMSQKESVRKNPLVDNPQTALDEMEQENKRSLSESYEL